VCLCLFPCTLPACSQEVVWGATGHVRLATPWRWIEDEEIVIHLLVHLHYARFVAAAIAIVGRGENCHDLLLMTPIVACHDELMRSGHRLKAILLYELV